MRTEIPTPITRCSKRKGRLTTKLKEQQHKLKLLRKKRKATLRELQRREQAGQDNGILPELKKITHRNSDLDQIKQKEEEEEAEAEKRVPGRYLDLQHEATKREEVLELGKRNKTFNAFPKTQNAMLL